MESLQLDTMLKMCNLPLGFLILSLSQLYFQGHYQETVGGQIGKEKQCREISGGVAFVIHYVIAQFSKLCSNLAYIFPLSKIPHCLHPFLDSITNAPLEIKRYNYASNTALKHCNSCSVNYLRTSLQPQKSGRQERQFLINKGYKTGTKIIISLTD